MEATLNDLKDLTAEKLEEAFVLYAHLLDVTGYKVTKDNWWRPVMALGAALGAVGGAVYVAGDIMHHGHLSQLADNMLGLKGIVPATDGKIVSDLSGTTRDSWYKHVPQIHEMIGDFGLDLDRSENMGSPVIGIALGEVVGLNPAGGTVDVTAHVNEFVPPVDQANIGVDGVGLTIGSYVYKDQKGQGKGGLLFATQLGQGDVVTMTDQINLANCDAQGMCPVRLVAWDPTKDKFVPLDLPDGKPAQVIVKIKFDPKGAPTEIQGILPGQTGDQVASTIGVGNKAVQDILFTGKPTAIPPTETPTLVPPEAIVPADFTQKIEGVYKGVNMNITIVSDSSYRDKKYTPAAYQTTIKLHTTDNGFLSDFKNKLGEDALTALEHALADTLWRRWGGSDRGSFDYFMSKWTKAQASNTDQDWQAVEIQVLQRDGSLTTVRPGDIEIVFTDPDSVEYKNKLVLLPQNVMGTAFGQEVVDSKIRMLFGFNAYSQRGDERIAGEVCGYFAKYLYVFDSGTLDERNKKLAYNGYDLPAWKQGLVQLAVPDEVNTFYGLFAFSPPHPWDLQFNK